MTSFLRALVVAVLVIGFEPTAHAEFFKIANYKSNVIIEKSAVLLINEELVVDFDTPRHGIFRKIPISYTLLPSQGERASRSGLLSFTGSKYSYVIYDISVDDEDFKTYTEGDYQVIRIGSADRLVSGRHVYKLHYKIFGGINFFSDHSEFYWNMVGTEWDVPIEHIEFSVTFPTTIHLEPSDSFIYTGQQFSKEKNAQAFLNDNGYSGESTQVFQPREGLTVGLRFPKDYLSEGSLWLKLKLFLKNNPFIILPLISFYLARWLWRKYGQTEEVPPVAAQFEPPQGMSPAEAGALIDDSLDNDDITALLFYWGSRGLISIEELPGGIFTGKDYKLTQLKPLFPDASSCEKILFANIFAGTPVVKISSLRNTFYQTLAAAKIALENEKLKRLYATGSRGLGLTMKVVAVALIVSGGAFFVIRLGLQNPRLYNFLSVLISFLPSSLFFFYYARKMPKKTLQGMERFQKLLGFKEFIQRVERPRLVLMHKENPKYFETTIAYAIVLGLGKEWAQKFEGIITEPPTWYVGPYSHAFTTTHFMNSLSSSVNTISSEFSSQPSQSGSGSSGFSGGGGSSGGGGGGGGGGSW